MDHRVARCHLLAEVLAADGTLTDEENVLLDRHMDNHALSDEERRQVRTGQGADAAIALLRERPSMERQEIVDELVEAAIADGRLTRSETDTVKRLALALGLEQKQG